MLHRMWHFSISVGHPTHSMHSCMMKAFHIRHWRSHGIEEKLFTNKKGYCDVLYDDIAYSFMNNCEKDFFGGQWKLTFQFAVNVEKGFPSPSLLSVHLVSFSLNMHSSDFEKNIKFWLTEV